MYKPTKIGWIVQVLYIDCDFFNIGSIFQQLNICSWAGYHCLFKTCEKPLHSKLYILMKSVTKKISPSVGLILCYIVTIF